MMTNEHPCPPGAYTWWFSRYEEGPYTDAETTDKDAALREAIGQGDVDEFPPDDDGQPCEYGTYIAWARPNHVRLDGYFDATDWIERVADEMEDEDVPDELGYRHPLDSLSGDDMRSLEDSVRSAIWHWQNRRGLTLRAYWLDMPYGSQWVRVPDPDAKQ